MTKILHLLLFLLVSPISVYGIDRCSTVFAGTDAKIRLAKETYNSVPEPIRSSWMPSRFTDPAFYSVGKPFRFIVIRPSVERVTTPQLTLQAMSTSESQASRPIISGSVISDINQTTFHNDFFMIVKVPAENIVSTAPVDIRTDLLHENFKNSNHEGVQILRQYQKAFPVIPVEELILSTSQGTYNEVLFFGTSPITGAKVEVVGWGIKEGSGWQTVVRTEIEKIAHTRRQPILSFVAAKTDINELYRRQRPLMQRLNQPN